jgi:hypothetical protein
MNMLERVARAIADNDPSGVHWDKRDDLGKRQAMWIARGVLLEMKKPTELMCEAGSAALPEFDDCRGGSDKPDAEDAGIAYSAMIGAALNEPLDETPE